jgi:hypothetical protein
MSRAARASGRSPGGVDALFEVVSDLTDAAKSYLHSEQGKKVRRGVATLLIVGAPLISELPLIRRSRVARALRTAAIGAIIIKGAEWLRDWEPARGSSVVEVTG